MDNFSAGPLLFCRFEFVSIFILMGFYLLLSVYSKKSDTLAAHGAVCEC